MGDGFRMIREHYICCTFYFCYYYIVIDNEVIMQLTITYHLIGFHISLQVIDLL